MTKKPILIVVGVISFSIVLLGVLALLAPAIFTAFVVGQYNRTSGKGAYQVHYGFMDVYGKMVTPSNYCECRDFHEGLAAVAQLKNPNDWGKRGAEAKWGYIDKHGKWIVEPKFDSADDFSDGLAAVGIKNSQFYIRKDGSPISSAKYSQANPFHNGLAIVSFGPSDTLCVVDKNSTLINLNLKASPELSPLMFSDGLTISRDRKYINEKGQAVFSGNFLALKLFTEGLGCVRARSSGDVREDSDFHPDDRYGYINRQGKFVIEPQYVQAEQFSEGLAPAVGEHKDECGYIDKSGKFVVHHGATMGGSFSEGLALFQSADRNFGYIDRRGSEVIKSQFTDAHDFHCGLAQVSFPDGKRAFISKSGEIAFPIENGASDFSEGLACVGYMPESQNANRNHK